ncbi:hypothetical protein VAMP_305n12 [Candidatus Vampirococcus lugosii]|uniref:Uncharacterized protein n=1 Tax=Candidatus Vampirococcus lugosii TaxID=2789015 RepID=A0ABS5QMX8_9BACT|nr:hypothetical protein [Candidatus Vampirococcus lugosii]
MELVEIYKKTCIKEVLKLSLNSLKLIKYNKMNYIKELLNLKNFEQEIFNYVENMYDKLYKLTNKIIISKENTIILTTTK